MNTTEHPLLSAVREGVAASGAHYQNWGILRREAFAGEGSWAQLKNWCAENALECELNFSHSPKLADVQFRKSRKS